MKLFKKIIVLTLFMLIFLLTNSYADTAIIDIEAARIRAEKNTTSTIITVVYEDDKVEILEKGNEWSKIKYGEFSGYVKTEFLKTDNSENKTENTVSNEKSNNLQTENKREETKEENISNQNTEPLKDGEIIISSETKMKLLPSFMSKSIQDLKIGQRYQIAIEINNWVKITDGTVEGWILKNKTTTQLINMQPDIEPEVKPENNTVNNTITNNTSNDVVNSVKTENEVEETTFIEEPNRNGSIESKNTGKVNVETAKIREKATTQSKNIGFLDYGDTVIIKGEENDFYKITFEDKNGYVSKKLITLEEKKTTSRSLKEERKEEVIIDIVEENINSLEPEVTEELQETEVASNNEVTTFARNYLNYPYVLGGKTPDTGFDCSGFTRYVYKQFGYNLASTAAGQTNVGDEVTKENLMPGDLILFQNEEKTKIGHTGIYLGNNEFIHAANPKRGVVIDNISTNSYYNERFVSARRIVK